MHGYEIRPRKDHRGVDLISDAPPFGRLWYDTPDHIINREIDDLRGTLFRQTMFAEFEKIIHAIEESGDALTLDVFKSAYHKLQESYFAENFVIDPELDLECLRIPHFYHAFYVYKYATGISAAVA